VEDANQRKNNAKVNKSISNALSDSHDAMTQTPVNPINLSPLINNRKKNCFFRLLHRLIGSPIHYKTAKIIPKFKTKSSQAYPQTIDKITTRAII